ncbi:RICIN domain-containing protein [Micromonospora rubida]|uniref:RICIN domain-containing protein n=1 Tax=Micromonospora rubida TaxID=2697657 RepID=UPI00137894ED|nr:RICIN domain-containing protein [Micromonospora rubida]NBE84239.1 hypothetical protein [Micromonospora rubida]
MAIGAPAMVVATPAQAQYVSVTAWGRLFVDAFAQSMAVSSTSGKVYMNNESQQWFIKDNAPNGHTILHARGCLDSNAAGAVYILGCNNGDYQRWHFNLLSSDSTGRRYEIVNKATGLCLSALSVGLVSTYSCGRSSYEVWKIRS